jgi:hypothetical protein
MGLSNLIPLSSQARVFIKKLEAAGARLTFIVVAQVRADRPQLASSGCSVKYWMALWYRASPGTAPIPRSSCAGSTKINGQRLRSHLPCSDFVTKTTLLKVGVFKTLEFAHNPKHAFIEGKAGMLFVPVFSLVQIYFGEAATRCRSANFSASRATSMSAFVGFAM